MDDDQQDNQDQTAPVTSDTGLHDAQADDSSTPSPDDTSSDNEELLEIKRSALEELSPLLDHLDQEPEEKFQTTMMMIQATYNKSLVSKAYEAAKQIKEDKERAQALLDIVNEINYFTRGKDDKND